MVRRNDRFRRGSGCYTCWGCQRQTRETGRGESGVGLCAQCDQRWAATEAHDSAGHDAEHPDADCPICTGQWERLDA